MTTPFSSLEDYIALPRVESLALSPDGRKAVLTVATLSTDRTSFDRALWEIEADGEGVPRRLTRSAKGESGAAFTGSGDVLFVSGRADASAAEAPDAPQLWLLPSRGGEARCLTRLAGGVSSIAATALDGETVVISADLLPSSRSIEEDAAARKRRTDASITAVFHESYPVRYWDHDLGPGVPHLLALETPGGDELPEVRDSVETGRSADESRGVYPSHLTSPRDLTPTPRRSADTAGQALTPDGRTLIASLRVAEKRSGRFVLVAIDVASGERTSLFDEPGVHVESPVISRDGRRLAFLRAPFHTADAPADQEIWVADIDGGDARRIATDWDRWPSSLVFDRDGTNIIATADHDGRGPIFRLPLDGSAPEQLTTDDFAYTHVAVDASSGDLVALRSSWTRPPHPVRVRADGEVFLLATPAGAPAPLGSITEVATTADDGARVRGWLLLPDGASAETPAPLLLWIHGGPLNSWNAWSWRWNPQLALAKGYAVLLPDPALSTGYGLDFIARGWNAWGAAPYTDLLAITDEAVRRDDIDEDRTAAMGGSFGGYMANWVAGHTDRFRAIVSHASLWALDQFIGTTDNSEFWQTVFTPRGLTENSPHHFVRDIVTPLLVVHGDRDYRVPVGESLRLWSELAEHHADDDGTTPHRFLLFPDENHWVLKPQHAVVWYETVFAFLDQHVHDRAWSRPAQLG
ncbi:dipeptidyl aminopeptidase/acylaminoacyl peptidase [Labedella gwakjiensis]|uniref:Dipeptidyl aminopeptidase/acylaminoacyl peptidase n=1 Tax=Labedella gwakjiensis TaxID=390269 RepID=A0A2P8H153_9MICO|nr:alpha/beta fold hydrolase [Labedella gwakjiensis]PSL39945.1 dipeptidyl aminopeptidase/acylaminoacyl peptidase [Labedella gwakjiensis]RUQ85695.1 S9 family peptidase [Labedella gwakjiensis]